MPIILLEGCDCVGKTTLAEALQSIWGENGAPALIVHRGPIPEDKDPLDEYITDLKDLISRWMEDDDQLIILDRWHIGEMVYGPIYRGRSRLSFKDFVNVDEFLHQLGVVQVILTAPIDVVAKRFAERGEDFAKTIDIQRILNGFEMWRRFAGGRHNNFDHVHNIDTTNQPVDSVARQLIAEAVARGTTH